MASPRLGKPDPHLEDDEAAPERTTPQGTQDYGVEHGHEALDTNPRALVFWFSLLAACVAVILGVLFGAFHLLLNRETAKDVMPSPLFAVKQVPPAPRLIPNPVDAQREPNVPLLNPIEYGVEVRRLEDLELDRLGLRDPATGLPRIPEKSLQGLAPVPGGAAPHAGVAPHDGAAPAGQPVEEMPSDSSGGTSTEDRLR
ncbi:MAG TPA: hypothetical protein VK689_17620 [Armatimonadota bacterium]|nr:hypothetical protein [Armatimonadota bacterium]